MWLAERSGSATHLELIASDEGKTAGLFYNAQYLFQPSFHVGPNSVNMRRAGMRIEVVVTVQRRK